MDLPGIDLTCHPLRAAAFQLEEEFNAADENVEVAEMLWDLSLQKYQRAVVGASSRRELVEIYDETMRLEERWNRACLIRDRIADDLDTLTDVVDLAEVFASASGTTEGAP